MTNKDKIFFWIPKNAGTSITRQMTLHGFPNHRYDFEDVKRQKFTSGNRHFGHYYIPALIEEGVIDNEYYNNALKFAVIRNPYDRAVSLWKFGWHRESFELFLQRVRRNGVKSPGLYNVTHDRINMCGNQISWITQNGNLLPDEIIHFETLDEEMGRLFGVTDLRRANKSVARESSTYREYYTAGTKALVEELYEPDLTYFDYEF